MVRGWNQGRGRRNCTESCNKIWLYSFNKCLAFITVSIYSNFIHVFWYFIEFLQRYFVQIANLLEYFDTILLFYRKTSDTKNSLHSLRIEFYKSVSIYFW